MKIVSALLLGLLVLGCGKDSNSKARCSPRISDVSPDRGDSLGGELVLIYTECFRDSFLVDVPVVHFGGFQATSVTPLSSNVLSVVTPPVGAPGPLDVIVESTGIPEVAVLPDGYICIGRVAELFGQSIALPSDSVVYVLNRSGAMSSGLGAAYVNRFGVVVAVGTRWNLIQERTIASIQGLEDFVEFNVLTFACNQVAFAPAAVPATAANKAAAEAWILGAFAWGGIGTGQGVADALRRDSSTLTFLLVDRGRVNCGATGYSGHLAEILAANGQGAAIHTFGIDVAGLDRDFRENISTQTGGTYTDITP